MFASYYDTNLWFILNNVGLLETLLQKLFRHISKLSSKHFILPVERKSYVQR